MSHSSIDSVAEPWFLLPLLGIWNNEDCFANYHYGMCRGAFQDLVSRMEGGEAAMRTHQREYCESVYANLAKGKSCRYFLDKTPRYHLIAEEISKTFPKAKIIFLWRNPISVVASMCDTWYDNEWKVHRHHLDLFHGVENLVNAAKLLRGRALHIQYEALVNNKEHELARLAEFLHLDAFSGVPTSRPQGRYGDPTGAQKYDSSVSSRSTEKWKNALKTAYRRRWMRRYLQWIGAGRLQVMGYDLEELMNLVNEVKTHRMGSVRDVLFHVSGILYAIGEPVFWNRKRRNYMNGYPVILHR